MRWTVCVWAQMRPTLHKIPSGSYRSFSLSWPVLIQTLFGHCCQYLVGQGPGTAIHFHINTAGGVRTNLIQVQSFINFLSCLWPEQVRPAALQQHPLQLTPFCSPHAKFSPALWRRAATFPKSDTLRQCGHCRVQAMLSSSRRADGAVIKLQTVILGSTRPQMLTPELWVHWKASIGLYQSWDLHILCGIHGSLACPSLSQHRAISEASW